MSSYDTRDTPTLSEFEKLMEEARRGHDSHKDRDPRNTPFDRSPLWVVANEILDGLQSAVRISSWDLVAGATVKLEDLCERLKRMRRK